MMEKAKQLSTWTLVVAILGIVTCTPFGLSFNGFLAIAVCAFSIYLVVNIPRDAKATRGAWLMIGASAAMVVSILVVYIAAGVNPNAIANMSPTSPNVDWSGFGPVAIGGVLAIASWVVRIVATVFAFMDYSKLKKVAATQEQTPM